MPIFIAVVIVLIGMLLWKSKQYQHYKFLYYRAKDINNILINVSEELNNFYDIDTLYNHLLEDTLSLIEGAEAGSILIYNPDEDQMDYKASVGYDFEELKGLHLKREELFLYKRNELKSPDIIRNPLVFDSINLDKKRFDKLIASDSMDLKSCISAPLYVNGEFYGIINVDSKTNINAFNKNDIKLIKHISLQLESAINNVLLMNELVQTLRLDKLTGLINRRYFEELMEEKIRDGEKGLGDFFLVMIDLDGFKEINDTYGHKLGDEALQFFSSILTKHLNPQDIAARYAGDEFILVVNGSSEEKVNSKIKAIRGDMNLFYRADISLSFSAGLCKYEGDYDLDRIITYADMEMYREKRERKRTFDYNCSK